MERYATRPQAIPGWSAPAGFLRAAAIGVGVTLMAACGGEDPELGQTNSQPQTEAVAAVPPPPPAPPIEEEPETDPAVETVTYGDAERVFQSGEYGEAARLFETYTVRRPENPWGHYMHGISAWRAGDHPRAEAALRETLEVDPEHRKGLINLARVLLEQGSASDALDYAEQVTELEPELGEGWRVLGNARSDLGMAEAAEEAYRRALVLGDEDAWTMNNLGLLHIRSGEHEAALGPLARAVELRPEVAVFRNNLGVALERAGQLELSAEAFRAALSTDEGSEKARVSLTRVESSSGPTSVETVELTVLASAFAEEVVRWREQATVATDLPAPDSVGTPPDGSDPR